MREDAQINTKTEPTHWTEAITADELSGILALIIIIFAFGFGLGSWLA